MVRERIANLPPDVSEVAMLTKLEDKESAIVLASQVRNILVIVSFDFIIEWGVLFVQVNDAVLILHEYNARLCAEMEDRKKLTTMLKDFQTEQRELLAQAEQRLQVNILGQGTFCMMKRIKTSIFR